MVPYINIWYIWVGFTVLQGAAFNARLNTPGRGTRHIKTPGGSRYHKPTDDAQPGLENEIIRNRSESFDHDGRPSTYDHDGRPTSKQGPRGSRLDREPSAKKSMSSATGSPREMSSGYNSEDRPQSPSLPAVGR